MLLALKSHQIAIVAAAADKLPTEKRSVFLQRVAGQLQLRGSRASDDDLGKMIHRAMSGLIQDTAA